MGQLDRFTLHCNDIKANLLSKERGERGSTIYSHLMYVYGIRRQQGTLIQYMNKYNYIVVENRVITS